ncbi:MULTISPECIES: PLP-dependent aminotransferase family protein [Acidiplasma]|jgi:2-aminoadipate transaminase|uniref:Aminotransferase n=2 Tax=Acidiplasma TaxID=507753 RepID=A0A0Q0VKZ0_9ARCH|nr:MULTISPECIES: PLP-dependent aminotransferase family protein [Acidiplasma]KJE48899.1 aminotransferase [Acidiplasma sp. MBA-1]KPV46792.1 aminotransferase [Acidiplasma aeolicum]KQB33965.1 aminotransferase [Acidiplasma aeolicum]KQB34117.1 aminotransferase [Acidiplasma cupricumulans]WMT54307.1 MAG: PLP-dependent aminotransferase family protein [Acidiplasma sp.]
MSFEFSDNLRKMKSSEIRSLLKYVTMPGMISFGGGLPNPETFPSAELKEIMDDVIENYASQALQYGQTDGLQLLKNEIRKFLDRDENIKTDTDNIMVTTGSQQSLYALSKIFANPGDYVITEAPTYVGMISSLNANLVNSVSVKMDSNGMIIEELEKQLEYLKSIGKKPKFIYTIPTFQNPAGYTMTLDRRKQLLEIAYENNIPVIEDNPYGDLRYSGTKIPTLKSLDDHDIVTYLGTFSKVMSPGLRTGYTVSQPEVLSRYNILKQALDLASDSLSQYIAYEYLNRGIIYKQIPKTIELYKKKRDIMLESLDEHVKDAVWSKPDGGMFLWLKLNHNIDTSKMLERALKNKVAYITGSAFYQNNPEINTMRLNFTYSSDSDIVEGVRRLAKTIEEEVKN